MHFVRFPRHALAASGGPFVAAGPAAGWPGCWGWQPWPWPASPWCWPLLVLQALKPAPGEWSTTWRLPTPLGAIERPLSVPVLLRWVTHPLAARLLQGRDWRSGTWQLHMGAAGEIRGECRPCLLPPGALGAAPVRINQASWQLRRAGPEQWQGNLHLGEAGRALDVAWRAQLRSDGMEIHAELPPAPIADALALVAGAVPEATRARVDGTLALRLDARWGARGPAACAPGAARGRRARRGARNRGLDRRSAPGRLHRARTRADRRLATEGGGGRAGPALLRARGR